MVSKEKQAKSAAEQVYRKYVAKIGLKLGEKLTEEQKVAVHTDAVAEAQKVKPDIDAKSIKKMLGFVMTDVNAEARRLAGEETKSMKLLKQDIPPMKDEDKPPASTVEVKKIDELEKRLAGMEGTMNNVAGAVQGLTEFLSKQTVRDNGRSEQTRQIEARFPAFEVKFPLDTFRMSLFQAWKADHRFEGEIEDFLKDAFDEALRQRGANLEYTSRKGSVFK